MLATVTMLRFLLCGVEEDFRRISRVDFTEGRPGKGGEWVMTTSAGEPMILPYDPPAWDPQSQNTTSLLFETSKKMPKIDTLDALDDEMTIILNTL